MTAAPDMRPFFSGARLYGDDFEGARLEAWYDEELCAYFELVRREGDYTYGDEALNRHHGFGRLAPRRFRHGLAFGCARGDDVLPIASQVERFTAIEPAREWWSDAIGGTPARYLAPRASGDLPLADASVDLVVSFGVLHHIANVSHVLAEIGRVAMPGALFLLREPIVSMGDWRGPRRNLTKNERGLPLAWLEGELARSGFAIRRRAFCMFPAIPVLARWLGRGSAYASPALVRLDDLASRLMAWNRAYHRDTLAKKLGPRCAFYILEKAGAPA